MLTLHLCCYAAKHGDGAFKQITVPLLPFGACDYASAGAMLTEVNLIKCYGLHWYHNCLRKFKLSILKYDDMVKESLFNHN